MPTPGFPDWLCVGAVVQTDHDPRFSFAITRIEFRPSSEPEPTPGIYVFRLTALLGDDPDIVPLEDPEYDLPLATLLTEFRWTGEVMDENEQVIATGTTMPVTFHTAILRASEPLHIQGSGRLGSNGYDGAYTIDRIHERQVHGRDQLHIVLERGDILAQPPSENYDQNMRAMLNADAEDASALLDTYDTYEPFEPIDDSELGTDAELHETMRVLAIPNWHEPGSPSALVAEDQVWLLPAPNQGLWRTSLARTNTGRGSASSLRLTHVREPNRIMNTTATWLAEHGVRQEPIDPRTTRTGQQVVVIGQIWEISAGSTAARGIRLWRIHSINERAGRLVLMAANGSGKRLYWTPQQLLDLGTHVGDGLPRRTSFERILQDDDGE